MRATNHDIYLVVTLSTKSKRLTLQPVRKLSASLLGIVNRALINLSSLGFLHCGLLHAGVGWMVLLYVSRM